MKSSFVMGWHYMPNFPVNNQNYPNKYFSCTHTLPIQTTHVHVMFIASSSLPVFFSVLERFV